MLAFPKAQGKLWKLALIRGAFSLHSGAVSRSVTRFWFFKALSPSLYVVRYSCSFLVSPSLLLAHVSGTKAFTVLV